MAPGGITALLLHRSLRAFVLKNGCCVRSSAANTISTAPARRGSFPRSTEAGSCRRTILPPPGLGADRCSSRKHFGARWPQDVPWSPLWRSNGVAREQCDFSGISHSYILWNFPLKSHSADAAQADRQAIRFSSIEIARRPSCQRRSRVPRRSWGWRRRRRGRNPRSRYPASVQPCRAVLRFWPP